jgi:hypothetical protein
VTPIRSRYNRGRGPAYVGERLALLGVPGLLLVGNPFTHEVTVLQGTVVATNHPQVLTSAD